MTLIRSIIFFIFLVLTTTLFAIPMFTIGMLMPYRLRCQIANAWGRVNLWLLSAICGLKYQVSGWENLPQQDAIILSKHQSSWETIALRGLLPPEQAWVLKRELLWIPLFGWALAAAEAIGIDRSSGRVAMRQVITKGTERLQQGRLVIIFPEGTRVAPGERKKYGIGGAMLAAKSGYPIVPIAHNAGVFWRRRGIRKYPGTIQLVIGPAIETKDKTASEINTQVEEWIESTVESLPKENAQVIGLIPDIPLDRVKDIGNAAGVGSKMALISKNARLKAALLSKKVEYVELSGRKDFQDEFMDAMFFPHSNLDYFPHVKELLG